MSNGDGHSVSGSARPRVNKSSQEIMNHAYKHQRKERNHLFHGRVHFRTIKDHILASVCDHAAGDCLVCKFESGLSLPSLPEMVFADNKLEVQVKNSVGELVPFLSFNTFDALRLVDPVTLPAVKVDASEEWQKALGSLLPKITTPFDWTYTSEYMGTIKKGIHVEDTTEQIDMEVLKREDPMLFYDAINLYEDELADNGCAEMTVKIRAMPTNYFILCRYYLRVDRVMIRICDCRIYSEAHWDYALLEFSKREALYKEIKSEHKPFIADPAQIWQYLPILSQTRKKLFYPS